MTPFVLIIIGLSVTVVVATALMPVARRFDVPHTLLLTLVVMAVTFTASIGGGLPLLADSLNAIQMPSEGLVYLVLPILLFAAVLRLDPLELRGEIVEATLWSVGSVVLCTAFVATTLNFAFGMSLFWAVLVGAVISPIDSGAIRAVLGTRVPKLNALTGAESTIGATVAVALVLTLLELFVSISEVSAIGLVPTLLWDLAGGLGVGYVAGLGIAIVISRLRAGAVIDAAISVALALLTFILAQMALEASGVVALVTAGLVFLSRVRERIPAEALAGLRDAWGQLEFWVTSLVLVLVLVNASRVTETITWSDVAALSAAFVAALGARAVLVWGLLPVFARLTRSPSVPHAGTLLFWSGLRGPVTLSLSMVAVATAVGVEVTPEARYVYVVCVGYVILSLLVFGPTLAPLARALDKERRTSGPALNRGEMWRYARDTTLVIAAFAGAAIVAQAWSETLSQRSAGANGQTSASQPEVVVVPLSGNQRLLSAGGQLHVAPASAPEGVLTLRGHAAPVIGVARRGDDVVSIDSSGVVRVTKVSPGAPINLPDVGTNQGRGRTHLNDAAR